VFCIGYKGTEDPAFNDFYDYLVSIKYKEDGKETGAEQLDGDLLKEIIITLEAYSEGGNYSEILNGKGSEDLLSGDFSLFEIGEIMDSHSKTYTSLCLFCIIRSFDRMMRQDVDSFKILVIEEAWKALSNKEMEPYLNSLWKTSRKYNTAAIVVTQQMSDIISSDIIKDTIIANSPIKIILDQRECISELDAVADTLGLTETDKRLIRSLNTDKGNNPAKEVFLKIGQGKSGAYKVEVSPSEALLFESSLKEKTELLSVIEKGTSIESFVKKNAKRILKTKA